MRQVHQALDGIDPHAATCIPDNGASCSAIKGILVSVIVPAFNAADTLAETLASVAAQSHRAVEILIVDDGSTDATPAVAGAFCASDARARLIVKPNGGVASARNRGIAAARGTFIAPIDADDLWHPDFVAACLAKAIEARAAMVFPLHRRIDYASAIIRSSPRVEVCGIAVRQMAYCNLVGNGSALLIDRAAALAVGGYDEQLRDAGIEGCEDQLFQLRIAARYPIASVPRYLVGYRQRAGAMSNDVERMTRSGMMTTALFRTAMPDLSLRARVWRWQHASALLTLARYRLRMGRVPRAIGAVLMAIGLDPIGSFAVICHDAGRLSRGALRFRRVDPVKSPHFLDIDPAKMLDIEGRARPDWWARLQAARLRDLAALDRADGAAFSGVAGS